LSGEPYINGYESNGAETLTSGCTGNNRCKRGTINSLFITINNSSIGIHVVSPEGIIVYANSFELEVLGYTKSEYIGHHVSEFQINEFFLSDMMKRLGNFEKLKNYPAKVQGKNRLKYIIYNSSVYQEGGECKHTRFFGTEVDEIVYDVYLKHFDLSNNPQQQVVSVPS